MTNKIKAIASFVVGIACFACAFKPPIDRAESTLMVIVSLAVIGNGIEKLIQHDANKGGNGG